MQLSTLSQYQESPDRLEQQPISPRPHIPMHVARSTAINHAQVFTTSAYCCMVALSEQHSSYSGNLLLKNNLNDTKSVIVKPKWARLATAICTAKFRLADILEAQTCQLSTRQFQLVGY